MMKFMNFLEITKDSTGICLRICGGKFTTKCVFFIKGKGSLAGLFVGDDFNEYLMDYILGLNYIT